MEHQPAAQRPDCFQCTHFVVSWDPRRPRACKLFGFKTPGLPSAVVFQSTGSECIGFAKKAEEQKERH